MINVTKNVFLFHIKETRQHSNRQHSGHGSSGIIKSDKPDRPSSRVVCASRAANKSHAQRLPLLVTIQQNDDDNNFPAARMHTKQSKLFSSCSMIDAIFECIGNSFSAD